MREALLKQARAKAARYCSRKERAPQQVLEKLISWQLEEAEAQEILAELTRENFLNEQRFCRAFCHDKFEFNRWGRVRIKMELTRFNLPVQVVSEGLNSIDPDRYREILNDLAEKRWKSLVPGEDEWIRKKKTIDYLLRKGFEYELVNDLVDQVSASKQ